jgi:hypothetical protein
VQRRRDSREHLAVYLKAYNAWTAGDTLSQLRFHSRDPMPTIPKT